MIDVAKELADRRVAIVDDNRAFRDIMRVMLRSFGFRRVDVFGDAAEAISFLSQAHADMVFVDLMMPHMNGLDLARELRHSRAVVNRSLAIVLVTGHASRATVVKAVAAGIDDVLVKPVSPRNVFNHLRVLMRPNTGYVAGEGDYFGPNIMERRRAIERRMLSDRWRMLKPERARAGGPPLAAPGRDLPQRTSLPGLNVPVRPAITDAFLLD